MKGMDIYSFIDPNALAEYCRSINHQFTQLEMTVIIFNSTESSPKKYAAYNWLIENTPDCEVPENKNYLYHWHYHASLHELLRRIMYVENKLYKLFMEHKPHHYYDLYFSRADCDTCRNKDCVEDSSEWCRHEKHLTVEGAIESALSNKHLRYFLIHKRNDKEGEMGMQFNSAGEPYEIGRFAVWEENILPDEKGITAGNCTIIVGGKVEKMILESIQRSM